MYLKRIIAKDINGLQRYGQDSRDWKKGEPSFLVCIYIRTYVSWAAWIAPELNEL